jgi:hypothetical protein
MLHFANPGALDIRSAITFGVNVKTGANSIGQFGTGLKYAIAGILRLGGRIYVETEDEKGFANRYDFIAVPETIRGKTFHLIHMEISEYPKEESQSVTLGFTTELGAHWQPWMLYRELRSNAMDENGFVDYIKFANGEVKRQYKPPFTSIIVDCAELEEVHEQFDKYFITGEPIWASKELEIYPPREDGAIFYRGIRVATVVNRKLAYTYNIKHECRLTEDRTLDLYSCQWSIINSVAKTDNREIAEKVLLTYYTTWEYSWSFDYVETMSEIFRETIKLNRLHKNINESARKRARSLYKKDYIPVPLPMTDAQYTRVNSIKTLLTSFGFPWPYEAIRLAVMDPESPYEAILIENTLYVGDKLFNNPALILHVLQLCYFEGNLHYDPFRAEKDFVRLMVLLAKYDTGKLSAIILSLGLPSLTENKAKEEPKD